MLNGTTNRIASLGRGVANIASRLKWLRFAFTPIAIAWMIATAWHWREEISEAFTVSSGNLLIVSVTLLILGHLVSALTARLTFALLGLEASYGDFARIHFRRLPTKYLPGGIWQGVSRTIDFSSRGMSVRKIATAIGIEYVFAILFALLVGGIVSAIQTAWPRSAYFAIVSTAAAATIGLFLIMMQPKRPSRRRWLLSLLIFVTYVISWLILMLAFTSYCYAVTEASAFSPNVIGLYPVAWAVGFLAFFAPQGIGVSEAAFAFMAAVDESDIGKYVVLMAGFRIMHFAADIIGYIGSRFVDRRDGAGQAVD